MENNLEIGKRNHFVKEKGNGFLWGLWFDVAVKLFVCAFFNNEKLSIWSIFKNIKNLEQVASNKVDSPSKFPTRSVISYFYIAIEKSLKYMFHI